MHLYFVKIEPGSTNMRTLAGGKVGGVLTPGPHRDWRHWRHVSTVLSCHCGQCWMPLLPELTRCYFIVNIGTERHAKNFVTGNFKSEMIEFAGVKL